MKVLLGVAGAVVAFVVAVAGAANASAVPLDGPLINTTCNYNQIVAALKVQAPDLAAQLAQRPDAQAKLQKFVALPVDQRKLQAQAVLADHPDWQATIDQKLATPEGQQKLAVAAQVANTCHSY